MMMVRKSKGLGERHQRILDFLLEYQRTNKYPPSIREIGVKTGISSTSVVNYYLDQLEKRGLKASIDTSSRHKDAEGKWVPDEIHTAAFRSYHTTTPNGYNLQISWNTHDTRLNLANAVNPKKVSGGGSQ